MSKSAWFSVAGGDVDEELACRENSRFLSFPMPLFLLAWQLLESSLSRIKHLDRCCDKHQNAPFPLSEITDGSK